LREQGLTKAQGIISPMIGPPRGCIQSGKPLSTPGETVCALREMLWAGKLPYIKDGRRILLDIQDMNAWVEKNKIRFG
jgi:hypothetical protein